MFVKERFQLTFEFEEQIRDLEAKFGYSGFGEFVFYRTYSRIKNPDNGYLYGNGGQETWHDVVIRVTNGCFSIRKDWYVKNHIQWDEEEWQRYAYDFAISMFHMHWLPPGRGLWAMGTPFVYDRGSMALYNCAYTDLGANFPSDLSWMMDCLMHGVGVGFSPIRDNKLELRQPVGKYDYVIPDSREGWCDSVESLLLSYIRGSALPIFDYSLVRAAGLPIKGFGGIASGPGPLKRLHEEIIESCERFKETKEYDSVRLKLDTANRIGCCVVAGNVRRSAELACAPASDPIFMDLKNYGRFPERESYGWMSNNSVILNSHEDFEKLGEIAERVKRNGEPGYINLRNLPFGRIGKDDGLRPDQAVGFNPCGEIPLEDKETCNIAETCPTVCETTNDWFSALEFAAFYTSTVSLLPTHSVATNRVVARNRRIGVGIIDLSGWKHVNGVHKVTRWLREGYQIVRSTNTQINQEAGVPSAIRVTTIKPGGTVPNLPGRTSGIGHPNFHYMIRRVRVQSGSPVARILIEAGVPNEPDLFSARTTVFEFPVKKGPAKEASKVSIWEQAMNLVWIQREWADNAVSNTLTFQPHEIGDVEAVLSAIAPLTKSVSLLPHSAKGAYQQMPEEGITEEEYEERLVRIQPIDWSKLRNSDGFDEAYCESDRCEVRVK